MPERWTASCYDLSTAAGAQKALHCDGLLSWSCWLSIAPWVHERNIGYAGALDCLLL